MRVESRKKHQFALRFCSKNTLDSRSKLYVQPPIIQVLAAFPKQFAKFAQQ